jgi:hypothetical protein
VATLRGLSDDQSDAKSVDVVLDKKDQVADSVSKAHDRYQTAGDALVEYAGVLDSAQASSAHALSQAKSEHDSAAQRRRDADGWGRDARGATDPDEKARYLRYQRQALADVSEHESNVSTWKQVVDQASHDVDVAAQKACDQINQITGTDGLNDSWWDDLSKVLEAIANIAEVISSITGILGMLLSWVPLLGPALLAISAITGVVAALCNVALAAGGKESWTTALTSVLFAAVGCLGLGGLKGMFSSIKGLSGLGKLAKEAGGIGKFLKGAGIAGLKSFASNIKSLFTGLKNLGKRFKNLDSGMSSEGALPFGAKPKVEFPTEHVEPTVPKPDIPEGRTVPIGERDMSLPYAKSRPTYHKGLVEKVWEMAKNASKDGVVRDPHTNEVITWKPGTSRKGVWDMGHIEGQEYRRLQDDYLRGYISKDDFLKEYNNPDNYHPETPSANRSRKYEAHD